MLVENVFVAFKRIVLYVLVHDIEVGQIERRNLLFLSVDVLRVERSESVDAAEIHSAVFSLE